MTKKTKSPETLMLSHGYNPWWSEGAVKPPIFLTSTFQFRNAAQGEEFFKVALGKSKKRLSSPGLIYSRINNPALEILEQRLAVWEDAPSAAAFASGMAAIATTVLALCKPGDVIAYTLPIYGGTGHFFKSILADFQIRAIPIPPDEDPAGYVLSLKEPRLRMIFLETPSNPTLAMMDIADVCEARRRLEERAKNHKILVAVDNTMLGPVFQQPIQAGADLSLYSATKFIGGHSDLIAGAVLGSKELLDKIHAYRSFLGTMTGPFTAWMLLRSLETLKIRMEAQAASAARIAKYLQAHPRVKRVFYPGLFEPGSKQDRIRRKQCTGDGSLLSFEVHGGKKKAFRVLDSVKLCHLAVSLGGTETLIEHPASMTHSELDGATLRKSGITDGMIRLSVGVENSLDIIADLEQALD